MFGAVTLSMHSLAPAPAQAPMQLTPALFAPPVPPLPADSSCPRRLFPSLLPFYLNAVCILFSLFLNVILLLNLLLSFLLTLSRISLSLLQGYPPTLITARNSRIRLQQNHDHYLP